MQLSEVQYNVLQQLAAAGDGRRIPELAAALNTDQAQVAAAAKELADADFLEISEQPFQEVRLGSEGTLYVDEPLPERVIIRTLAEHGGKLPFTEVPKHCGLDASQVGQSLRFLNQRGWARKNGDELVLQDAGQAALDATEPDEAFLRALAGERSARVEEIAAEGIDTQAALKLLAKRKNFLVLKDRTDRFAAITDAGRELLAGGVEARASVTQLTPDMLADGSWRDVELKPYDVTLAAKERYPGKTHAFQRTMDMVRRVFLEMGFQEIYSPWVESSFWDFDALYQPQDHPARDMQDTFYVGRPDHAELPDEKLVDRVRATHEDGGDTGSTGWQYRWSKQRAHKPVLRTHTTAATIRALAKHTQGQPGKYFVIGPVFRRETIDYKHLPVFHQVDGIIVDQHASLATLLGTLKAFYRKMGFEKVRVVPSFFPYTEPSAEVHIYMESRQDWVEMGGSGMFRPEVTRPLGIQDRVLAWGLGLDRLAMLQYGVKSLSELFFADMSWLRETPVVRE
jgi:phenylalanyl-tRNA synthetase alpha chain